MGKSWKRVARDPHFSTHASFMNFDVVGPKRLFHETITEKDEDWVDGFSKSRKRGKLVADNHDNDFPTAEADDQPRRA